MLLLTAVILQLLLVNLSAIEYLLGSSFTLNEHYGM